MKITCKHWMPGKAVDGGECKIGVRQQPSFGTCARCPQYDGERPALADESCVYRGEEVGERLCPSCGGNVKAKIMACQIHELSTQFSKPIDGVKSCHTCTDRKPATKELIIRCEQGLGDVTCLSGALRDLHIQYPGKYAVHLRTWAADLFKHNPHVASVTSKVPVEKENHRRSFNDGEHPVMVFITQYHDDSMPFVSRFHEKLSREIGSSVPCTKIAGDLRLSDDEKAWNAPWGTGPFWILNAGSKADFTVKQSDPGELAKVVQHFAGRLTFVQTGGKDHHHPAIPAAFDFRGRPGDNDYRRAMVAMYRADGVLTPISWPMHLAAALECPPEMPQRRACVVLAGGREAVNMIQYPKHRVLHTIGELPCCADGPCWRMKVDKDCPNGCDAGNGLRVAECMKRLTADRIIEAIESYYRDGKLVIPTSITLAQMMSGIDGMRREDAEAIGMLAMESKATAAALYGDAGRVRRIIERAGARVADNGMAQMVYVNAEDEAGLRGAIERGTGGLAPRGLIFGDGYHRPHVHKTVDDCFGRENIQITGASVWSIRP